MLLAGFATRAELMEALDVLRQSWGEPIVLYSSSHELLSAVGRQPVDAILIELHDLHGRSTVPLIEALRQRSEVALLGMVAFGDARDLLVLPNAVRFGLDDLILLEEVEYLPEVLRQTLERLSVQRATRTVAKVLRNSLSTEALALLHLCMRCANAQWDAQQLATMLGVHRVTLARHFSEAGLPSPGASLRWARLLVAAGLLAQHDRTVERVSRSIALPSRRSLRLLTSELVGMPPAMLRDSLDPLAHVTAAFLEHCGSA